jgi:ribonuclease P protein subunit RPR2
LKEKRKKALGRRRGDMMGKKDNKKGASGGGGKNGKGVNLAAISNVPNRDIMQRMNFLWQASVYFEGLGGGGDLRGDVAGASTSTRSGGDNDGGLIQEKRARRTKKVDGCDLAKMYVRTMNIVGQRTTTKMFVCFFYPSSFLVCSDFFFFSKRKRDPSVKRTLCRGCSSVLVPGISVRIRTRRESS